jgi:hypothetical protein
MKSATQTPSALTRMQRLLDQWEPRADRRAIFLSCYSRMTRNMLLSLEKGLFNDPPWVNDLLEHFAAYYFNAMDAYDGNPLASPAVWQQTFSAAADPRTRPVQHLLLGVNAHINYDLVLALIDVLEPEWPALTESRRLQRYADHCQINDIIAHTIDEVQDEVLECYSPAMDLIDRAFGRLDEFLIARLISGWRDQVWRQVVQWFETTSPEQQGGLLQQVESACVQRGQLIQLNWRGFRQGGFLQEK